MIRSRLIAKLIAWRTSTRSNGGEVESKPTYEVWVCTFPDGQGRWQVSSTGATEPQWSPNGRELFYVTEGHLVSAAVTTSPSFQASPPQRLFPVAPFVLYGVFNRNYDVMPDGRRFLMIRRDEEQITRLMAAFNWRAQLDRDQR